MLQIANPVTSVYISTSIDLSPSTMDLTILEHSSILHLIFLYQNSKAVSFAIQPLTLINISIQEAYRTKRYSFSIITKLN